MSEENLRDASESDFAHRAYAQPAPRRAFADAPNPTHDDSDGAPYLEVWGDTVQPRRLAIGLVLGVSFALIGLLGGEWLVSQLIDDEKLARTWSLVTGLVGCVTAGVIVSLMFRPAREVTQTTEDTARVEQAVAEIAAEPQGLGELEQASEASRRELSDAGLTNWFDNNAVSHRPQEGSC